MFEEWLMRFWYDTWKLKKVRNDRNFYFRKNKQRLQQNCWRALQGKKTP